MVDAEAGRGTFREIWRLAWAPELAVNLAEALVYGITIEQASAGAAKARATATAQISDLADLVRRCLLSDLPDAAERCIALLQAAAVSAVDVASLMRAVPSLVSVLRYGTARKMPLEALSALARALVVEVNAGVGLACRNLDDNAAEEFRQAMAAFDAALALLGDAHLGAEWNGRLQALINDPSAVPLVAGLALRLLYDRGVLDQETLAVTYSRSLSSTIPPKAVGQWLQGFLGSTAEVILQDDTLRELIDGWLSEQREEDFIELLPLLRRAFSNFGPTERRRLLARVGKGVRADGTVPASALATESPGFQKALPLLLKILGIKEP
jgi:tetratricopeptide (TPR) repeat protein